MIYQNYTVLEESQKKSASVSAWKQIPNETSRLLLCNVKSANT